MSLDLLKNKLYGLRAHAMRACVVCVVAVLLAACANRGVGPQGGPRDSLPPQIVGETPLNGMLNYHGNRVEIAFNEYIQLDNVVENVVISPPQQKPPIVKAIGKRVVLTFEEELQDSTTYTIDFGSSICDFTEKNPLPNYTFSFSTGMSFDSLEIYGYVVNAADLNPVPGVVVGIQSNLDDTAFSTLPFTRIAKSGHDGDFAIRNIHAGEYRLYALNDVSRDYLYQPGEGLAFADATVIPYQEYEQHSDTLWRMSTDTLFRPNDSIPELMDTIIGREIDTIMTHRHRFCGPDDLVLWYFVEDKQRHYFQRATREKAHCFQLVFSAPQDSLPQFRSLPLSVIDSTLSDSSWVDWMPYTLWQSSARRDTITCWLTDSMAISQDTLLLEMTYQKSDSVYELFDQTDTLRVIYRAPRLTAKAREAIEKKNSERKLDLRSNASNTFHVYDTLTLRSDFPIDSVNRAGIQLYQKVDTVYRPLQFTWQAVDSSHMSYHVIYPYEPEMMYELRVDSAALRDIYGVCNMAQKYQMKVRSLEEYSSLRVHMRHYDARARIQLLDEKETVLRELPADAAGTMFKYLTAKTVYMRLYMDENGDGHWTTGDWMSHRQPEPVYYFHKKLNLRANWDFEETFDHLLRPQLEAKPQEILREIDLKKK